MSLLRSWVVSANDPAGPLPLNNLPFGLFYEDGDRLILLGHGEGDGYCIGFGDCAGAILPAPTFPH